MIMSLYGVLNEWITHEKKELFNCCAHVICFRIFT